jgi:colanic acid biosynthesis glycosyl transferase WcaI
VTVVTAGGGRCEDAAGVRVLRCPLVAPAAPGAMARRMRHVSFAMASAPALLAEAVSFRPDIVGSLTPSAAAASSALAAARFARVPAWLHLEEGAEPLGIEALFEFVSLAAFDADAMLEARGVAPEAGLPLPAWADTFAILPSDEASDLRGQLARADEILALYVGHCDEATAHILIDAARTVPPRGAIRFIAAGAGPGLVPLIEATSDLPQLAVLSLPPPDALGELLACADIHLLPEGVARHDPRIGGKLGALLASGRPIVAGSSGASAPARALPAPVADAIVTVPAAGEDMAMAVIALAADERQRVRRGLAARFAAESYFAKERVFRALEKSLESLSARH